MDKSLKVSILGKQYFISTDENDGDVVQAAQLVDTMMKSKVGNTQHNDSKAAIIVALQLATDLTKCKRLLQLFETKTEGLNDLLETELKSS